jgi:hypothetical protein
MCAAKPERAARSLVDRRLTSCYDSRYQRFQWIREQLEKEGVSDRDTPIGHCEPGLVAEAMRMTRLAPPDESPND